MANKHRSVSPGMWDHAFLLEQTMATRLLWHYLVEVAADDEGRFRPNPLMLLRGAFSPIDGITVDDTRAMLDALAGGGLILFYESDGETIAFLTGWYEHQRIDRRSRSESALPPPPVEVCSWDRADQVRREYAQENGISDPERAQYREALRWKDQLGYKSRGNHAGITRESRGNLPSEGKGIEGKGREGRKERPAPPAGDAPLDQTPPNPLTPEQQIIADAWAAHDLGPLPPGNLKGYSGLVQIVKEHGIPRVRQWIASFANSPPPVPEGADAWNWFRARFASVRRPWEWDGTKRPQKPNRGMIPPTSGKVRTNEWGEQVE